MTIPGTSTPWHETLSRGSAALMGDHRSMDWRTREAILWIGAVLVALLNISIKGFFPYNENGVFHIPMLRHMIDPAMYPDDPFISLGPNYYSLLWTIVTHAGRVFELENVMYTGYVIQQVLLHYTFGAIAFRMGGNLSFSLGAMFWLVARFRPVFGGSYFMNVQLTHTSLSFPILLLALVFIMDRRLILAGITYAFAANIHLPNATYMAPVLGVVGAWHMVVTERDVPLRNRILRVIGCVAAIGVCMTPVLYYAKQASKQAGTISWHEFGLLVGAWIRPHVYWHAPLNLGFPLHVGGQAACLMLQFAMLLGLRNTPARPVLLGTMAINSCILVGIHATNSENVALARLMWMRAGDHILMLTIIGLLALPGPWVRGELRASRLFLPSYMLCLFFAGRDQFSQAWTWIGMALSMLAAILAYERVKSPSPEGFRTTKVALGLTAAVFLPTLVLWHSQTQLGLLAGWIKLALFLAALLAAYLMLKPRQMSPGEALAARLPAGLRATPVGIVLLLACFAPALVGWDSMRKDSQGKAGSMRRREKNETYWANWLRTQRWARENTPQDAMIVTPPYLDSWRVWSFRRTFLEVRDGNNVVLDYEYTREFQRRLRALRVPSENMNILMDAARGPYLALKDEDFLRIHEEFGANYAVIEELMETSLPIVYQNENFRVIRMGS